ESIKRAERSCARWLQAGSNAPRDTTTHARAIPRVKRMPTNARSMRGVWRHTASPALPIRESLRDHSARHAYDVEQSWAPLSPPNRFHGGVGASVQQGKLGK